MVYQLEKYVKYSPILVRLGIGIVFFLFGIMQLTNPEGWIAWLPAFTFKLVISTKTFILINGLLDLAIGGLLLSGLFVRPVALVGALHLAGIIVSLGFNDVAIRDFGMLLALISLFLHGSDKWCLGNKDK